jgi:predicted DNA-binding protein
MTGPVASLVSCGFPGNPTGITGRTSTKEVSSETATFQLPPAAHAARRQGKAEGMKTIAIRLEDETSELLSLVAQLEGTSQIDQIREAIASHLGQKIANGDLTARAQEALDDVDREASAKRKAIEQLVSTVSDSVRKSSPARRSRKQTDEPSSPEGHGFPIGFAPGNGRQQ